MKKKKPYIAPEIKIIPMDIENLMGNPTSWNVYDENGNPTGDGGSVIEATRERNPAEQRRTRSQVLGSWICEA